MNKDKGEIMKKKICVASLVALGLVSSLKADYEFLTGDTALACEAILCLSSPVRPSECMPSLSRYFGISYKKFSDTMKARVNFLNLCPAGDTTPEMKDQINKLSQITGYCTTQELNANLERSPKPITTELKCSNSGENGLSCDNVGVYGYRTSPTMTKNCQILKSMSYNDYNFKYTCNKEFYAEYEWNNGKKIISEISKQEYDSLDEAHHLSLLKWERRGISYSQVTHYYKAEPIKKDCWVDNR